MLKIVAVLDQIWLGGDAHQTRLAEPFMDRMKLTNLESVLEPIFFYFKNSRKTNEDFGDFCARVGFDALRNYSNGYIPVDKVEDLQQIRVNGDVYEKLDALAKSEGKTMPHLVTKILEEAISGV